MELLCAVCFLVFALLMWLFSDVFKGAGGSPPFAQVWADFRATTGWSDRLAYLFIWFALNTKKSVLLIWGTVSAAGGVSVAAVCGLDRLEVVLKVLDHILTRMGLAA